jgi:hypothetical protein
MPRAMCGPITVVGPKVKLSPLEEKQRTFISALLGPQPPADSCAAIGPKLLPVPVSPVTTTTTTTTTNGEKETKVTQGAGDAREDGTAEKEGGGGGGGEGKFATPERDDFAAPKQRWECILKHLETLAVPDAYKSDTGFRAPPPPTSRARARAHNAKEGTAAEYAKGWRLDPSKGHLTGATMQPLYLPEYFSVVNHTKGHLSTFAPHHAYPTVRSGYVFSSNPDYAVNGTAMPYRLLPWTQGSWPSKVEGANSRRFLDTNAGVPLHQLYRIWIRDINFVDKGEQQQQAAMKRTLSGLVNQWEKANILAAQVYGKAMKALGCNMNVAAAENRCVSFQAWLDDDDACTLQCCAVQRQAAKLMKQASEKHTKLLENDSYSLYRAATEAYAAHKDDAHYIQSDGIARTGPLYTVATTSDEWLRLF